MKKSYIILLLGLMVFAFGISSASAIPVLQNYAFNIDGSIIDSDSLTSNIDISEFNGGLGLGTVTITVGGAGDHFVGAFFNHGIIDLLDASCVPGQQRMIADNID